jgi:hypothetical protein
MRSSALSVPVDPKGVWVIRSLRRTVVIVGLVLGFVLSTSGAALADSSACTPGCDGYAVFISNGEILEIHDWRADGHSVVVWNKRYDLGGNWYQGWNPNGYGTVVRYNLEIPEGVRFDYYVCLGEYGIRATIWSTCSGTRFDRA